MSDKITTLHLKNDPSTNVYPNVKIENIPLDVTITRDGENLAKTKTIYDFTTSKFLSLDGGTMMGNIITGGFARPEEVVLGDGLDVSDLSSPAEPVTHYGCGYIRQDDDEDTSVKYHYNFPKENGTLITEDDSTYTFTLNNSKLSIISSHIVRQGNLVFVHIMLSVNENMTGSQDYGIFNFTISHEHRGVTLSSNIGVAYWWAQANGKLRGYGSYNAGEYIDVEFFASINEIIEED